MPFVFGMVLTLVGRLEETADVVFDRESLDGCHILEGSIDREQAEQRVGLKYNRGCIMVGEDTLTL